MLELSSAHISEPISLHWALPPSKSLMARRLVLSALCGGELPSLEALSLEDTPEDIRALLKALQESGEGSAVINVGESGTAMRFMTAYLSVAASIPCRLEGTARQHDRPIAPLVDALRTLGADIQYLDKEGYPPLYITPRILGSGEVTLDATLSSQYLSALFLLAPRLVGRVAIHLSGSLASAPYAYMTQAIVREGGYRWIETRAGHFVYEPCTESSHRAIRMTQWAEADWSAASYAYTLVALLPSGSECYLRRLIRPSLQGDSLYLPLYMERLGVYTEPTEEGIRIYHREQSVVESFEADMSPCPDLVPALVTALVGRGVPFRLRGVAHLRVKESDRLGALSSEFAKLGIPLGMSRDELYWTGLSSEQSIPEEPSVLDPHQDHRIAMALSLMTLRTGRLRIQTPEVVAKSFPSYWAQLASLLSLGRSQREDGC